MRYSFAYVLFLGIFQRRSPRRTSIPSHSSYLAIAVSIVVQLALVMEEVSRDNTEFNEKAVDYIQDE